ncbi:DoxX family protein [Flavobacterium marginilacus]|uniref:DoxX family protein n=1 Tax=Flavobacterium marginilacus TaxID=3003256 RepID=UPI00248F42A8|nr:DoxX family protein [Flavobacterium marginilacus]
MKKDKIIYWVSTGLLGLTMLMSAYMYVTDPKMEEGFKHLGYSDAFRIELAIAKVIGVLVLLIPVFSSKIKEWAYAGFGITFIMATIAHYAANDPINIVAMPVFFMIPLIISNIYFSKTKSTL